jgi:hypothetical protein
MNKEQIRLISALQNGTHLEAHEIKQLKEMLRVYNHNFNLRFKK